MLFTLILLALGINFVVYVLYQLIWGHKPLKALVGGSVGLLIIALYGGKLMSGSTLAQASAVVSRLRAYLRLLASWGLLWADSYMDSPLTGRSLDGGRSSMLK